MTIRILCVLPAAYTPRIDVALREQHTHRAIVVGATDCAQSFPGLMVALAPDVVLYDPTIDSGELLIEWSVRNGSRPALVVVTHDASYAVMAFEAGAVHYLCRDMMPADVHAAIDRCARRLQRNVPVPGIAEPLTTYTPSVIALPVCSGIVVRSRNEIVHVVGEGNYSTIHFAKEQPITMSRTIGEYESVLEPSGFLRVHRSHIVNLCYVRKMLRGKDARLELSNGHVIDVSEKYRERLLRALGVSARRSVNAAG